MDECNFRFFRFTLTLSRFFFFTTLLVVLFSLFFGCFLHFRFQCFLFAFDFVRLADQHSILPCVYIFKLLLVVVRVRVRFFFNSFFVAVSCIVVFCLLLLLSFRFNQIVIFAFHAALNFLRMAKLFLLNWQKFVVFFVSFCWPANIFLCDRSLRTCLLRCYVPRKKHNVYCKEIIPEQF